MKKYFLIAILSLSIGAFSQATFSWERGIDSMTTTIVGSQYVELKMNQINESGDTLNLGIEIVEKDIPSEWDGMVCLYGKCLGMIPDTGTFQTMNALFGDEKGYVRWTVSGRDTEAEGKLRIRVYDLDNEMYSDTATWIVTSILDTTDETSSIEDIENATLVYPNPSNGILNWTSEMTVDQILVFDILGNKILEQNFAPSHQESVQLPNFNGLAFVYLQSEGKTLSIEKVLVRD